MLRFPGGFRDEPAPETKFAPYGSNLEMDCHTALEPPIQFHWKKLGGLLPSDTQILEVRFTCITKRVPLKKFTWKKSQKTPHDGYIF